LELDLRHLPIWETVLGAARVENPPELMRLRS
jgi:hypothetical protein